MERDLRLEPDIFHPLLFTVVCVCLSVKPIPWRLAESYYNGALQRPYTGTCTILQETINWFLCRLIAFLKSKTYQLNFEGCD